MAGVNPDRMGENEWIITLNGKVNGSSTDFISIHSPEGAPKAFFPNNSSDTLLTKWHSSGVMLDNVHGDNPHPEQDKIYSTVSRAGDWTVVAFTTSRGSPNGKDEAGRPLEKAYISGLMIKKGPITNFPDVFSTEGMKVFSAQISAAYNDTRYAHDGGKGAKAWHQKFEYYPDNGKNIWNGVSYGPFKPERTIAVEDLAVGKSQEDLAKLLPSGPKALRAYPKEMERELVAAVLASETPLVSAAIGAKAGPEKLKKSGAITVVASSGVSEAQNVDRKANESLWETLEEMKNDPEVGVVNGKNTPAFVPGGSAPVPKKAPAGKSPADPPEQPTPKPTSGTTPSPSGASSSSSSPPEGEKDDKAGGVSRLLAVVVAGITGWLGVKSVAGGKEQEEGISQEKPKGWSGFKAGASVVLGAVTAVAVSHAITGGKFQATAGKEGMGKWASQVTNFAGWTKPGGPNR